MGCSRKCGWDAMSFQKLAQDVSVPMQIPKIFRAVLAHRSEHRMGKTEMLIQLHAMPPNCHWQFELARSKGKVRRPQHLHQIAMAMVLEFAI